MAFFCSPFSNIFLKNSLKDFEHFKFLGTRFQIWAPAVADAHIPPLPPPLLKVGGGGGRKGGVGPSKH